MRKGKQMRSFDEWEQITGDDVPRFLAKREEVSSVLLTWLQLSMDMHFQKFVSGVPVDIADEDYVWSRVAHIHAAIELQTFLRVLVDSASGFRRYRVSEKLITPWAVFVHSDGSLRDAASAIIREYRGNPSVRDGKLLALLGAGHKLENDAVPWEVELQLDKLPGYSNLPHGCGCGGGGERFRRDN